MPTCDVLLAAYNGTKYGPALLDSLLGQTCQDFRLLVRDDGSKDGTLEMLHTYAARFEGRMQIIESGEPTGSALGNFSILIGASDADHVLCADIDDVWLPTKVEMTLALLRETERARGVNTPIYAFTDVVPVDGALQPIAESYWKYKKIDPEVGRSLNQSLVCAAMLGCASGMNRALVDLIRPVPASVTGHDWWALLVAISFGEVVYSPERTMLYRLHGANSSQPKEVSFMSYLRKLDRIELVRHGLQRRRDQAQALIDRFGDTLPPAQHRTISDFVATGSQGLLRRRLSMVRGGYLYADAPRNLATLLAM